MINFMSLEGRTVVVTGAGQGIGYAVSEVLIELGARVVAVDVNVDAIASLSKKAGGDRVLALAGSVADAKFIEESIQLAVTRFGPLHGLVNNAGISRPSMIEKMTQQQWHDVLDVNLTGAFNCLQAVGRHMIVRAKSGEENPGSIVNVSSDAARRGSIGQVNYSAAKAGMLGMTMSAAREWAKHGIRVNTIMFGVVDTPMTTKLRTDEKLSTAFLANIPMGRWASAAEVSKPVAFLLSDAASYITGQHISVNGGYAIGA